MKSIHFEYTNNNGETKIYEVIPKNLKLDKIPHMAEPECQPYAALLR